MMDTSSLMPLLMMMQQQRGQGGGQGNPFDLSGLIMPALMFHQLRQKNALPGQALAAAGGQPSGFGGGGMGAPGLPGAGALKNAGGQPSGFGPPGMSPTPVPGLMSPFASPAPTTPTAATNQPVPQQPQPPPQAQPGLVPGGAMSGIDWRQLLGFA